MAYVTFPTGLLKYWGGPACLVALCATASLSHAQDPKPGPAPVYPPASEARQWSGFSLLAEYVVRDADRNRHTRVVDGAEVTEWSRSGWGYIVQGGQMLTDKLELVARWDDLHAFKGTDPQLVQLAQHSGRQVGGGVNYYVNEHRFKFQGDYFYAFNRLTDQPLHAVRVQLDATF